MLRIAKIVVVIAGFSIAFLGLLAGGLYLISPPIVGEEINLLSSTLSISFAALGLGLGLPLAWQGVNSLRGRPSQPFRPGPARLLLAALVAVLILGQVVLAFDIVPALAFPPLYILGAVLPPLFFLAFVGRHLALSDIRWREVILQLSSGAFLATFGAFSLEIVLGLLTMIAVLTLAAMTPGGATWLQETLSHLQDPRWLQNPTNAYEVLLSPPILITLGLIVLVVVPLVEELLKSLGVVIMGYRRPTRARAFLWGLTGGAGFALAEGLLSGALSLDDWGQTTILRVGATAMHCLGSGLMGLGWQHLFATRRPWYLLGAYTISASLHSLWNAAAFGIVVVSFTSTAGETGVVLGGLINLALIAFLSLLTLSTIFTIVYLTKWLRNYSLAQLDEAHQVPPSSPEFPWSIERNSREIRGTPFP